MNEPRGPLSPSVYRRRRAMAMAGLGVGTLLFVWLVAVLVGGSDSPAVHGAADVGPGPRPPLTSGRPSDPPATGPLAPPAGSASTSAPTSTTTTTTTPTPPTACPDSAMRVTVTTDRSSYRSGARPVLTLHIANAGHVPCLRDVSHQLRSIEVLAVGDPKPVWANSYCYTADTREIHTFAPGAALSYTIRWAGRTSAPGCPTDRSAVPAGRYAAVGKLGGLTGPPTPFTIG